MISDVPEFDEYVFRIAMSSGLINSAFVWQKKKKKDLSIEETQIKCNAIVFKYIL